MGKKPNAADIAHALALLGGGAKKDGGDGMLGGIRNIFGIGFRYGMDISPQVEEQKIMIEKSAEVIEVKSN